MTISLALIGQAEEAHLQMLLAERHVSRAQAELERLREIVAQRRSSLQDRTAEFQAVLTSAPAGTGASLKRLVSSRVEAILESGLFSLDNLEPATENTGDAGSPVVAAPKRRGRPAGKGNGSPGTDAPEGEGSTTAGPGPTEQPPEEAPPPSDVPPARDAVEPTVSAESGVEAGEQETKVDPQSEVQADAQPETAARVSDAGDTVLPVVEATDAGADAGAGMTDGTDSTASPAEAAVPDAKPAVTTSFGGSTIPGPRAFGRR